MTFGEIFSRNSFWQHFYHEDLHTELNTKLLLLPTTSNPQSTDSNLLTYAKALLNPTPRMCIISTTTPPNWSTTSTVNTAPLNTQWHFPLHCQIRTCFAYNSAQPLFAPDIHGQTSAQSHSQCLHRQTLCVLPVGAELIKKYPCRIQRNPPLVFWYLPMKYSESHILPT